MQFGAAAAERIGSGAGMQLGAAATGRGRSGAPLLRDGVAVGHGCGLLPMQRGGPSAPHNSVSLSAHSCRERNGENEGSPILPLFVLSSFPLHTSPRPPPITVLPLSLLPTHLFQRVSTSPNQPTSSSLNDHSQSLFLPIRPPVPSLLLLPLHPSPFPVPSSFPVSLSLSLSRFSPPSSPFLTLPFPLSRYPCDLPQSLLFFPQG